jgi:lipoic acid synthetase
MSTPDAGPAAVKERGAAKTARIPVKIEPGPALRKPAWIRAPFPGGAAVQHVKAVLRAHRLHTVCEEASCPNLGECFGHGTATFMILGDVCTRRCPFCDVAHGRPRPPDAAEPENLARVVADLGLKHVVVTSVDRDDLRDGGAAHFAACIRALRAACPDTRVEVLVPDFRGRLERALEILLADPPDVFNHNIETVPRLYREVRPGADYAHSLRLLQAFAAALPLVPAKSGLMLGVGETTAEAEHTLCDLHAHGVRMLTIGQYLQPSRGHLPVRRYAPLEEFTQLEQFALTLGFEQVASGPMVRSSYHADQQAAQYRHP